MASQVQYRRGTNAQNASFTGALAEITVDTTNGTLRVHDAITVGGSNIATVAYVTSQISALSANSISFGTSSVAVIASGGNIRANVGGSTITNTYSSGLAVTGLISATGAVTAASVVGGVITGSSTSVTGTTTAASVVGGVITGTSLSVSGNINGGNLVITGILVDNTGNLDLQTTATNGNVNLIPNGTGNVVVTGNLMPTANATANIGSATLSYNTIFAKATSAQYADLAEMYVADTAYAPGTVVEFGGDREITATTTTHSTQVAGIISTQPAYLMNSTQTGEHPLEVALVGRVPCSVVGTVHKGDRLVSSGLPGVAQALDINLYQPGCIVGKALQEYSSTKPGVIEVAVGRS